MSSINVYGCGGCGVTIASSINGSLDQFKTIAGLKVILADTSKADVVTNTEGLNVEFLSAHRGSGKVKSATFNSVDNGLVDSLLTKYPPSNDLNILLFGAGGASGANIVSALVPKIRALNKPIMLMAIISEEDFLTIKNDLTTMMSLEAQVNMTQRSIITSYFKNMKDMSNIDKVNEEVIATIGFLANLYNDNIRRLDREDILNWLEYDRVLNTKPSLMEFHIFTDAERLKQLVNPISTLSIFNEDKFSQTGTAVDSLYYKHGFWKSNDDIPRYQVSDINKPIDEIHYVISTGSINELITSLKDKFNKEKLRLSETDVVSVGDIGSISNSKPVTTTNGVVLDI